MVKLLVQLVQQDHTNENMVQFCGCIAIIDKEVIQFAMK